MLTPQAQPGSTAFRIPQTEYRSHLLNSTSIMARLSSLVAYYCTTSPPELCDRLSLEVVDMGRSRAVKRGRVYGVTSLN